MRRRVQLIAPRGHPFCDSNEIESGPRRLYICHNRWRRFQLVFYVVISLHPHGKLRRASAMVGAWFAVCTALCWLEPLITHVSVSIMPNLQTQQPGNAPMAVIGIHWPICLTGVELAPSGQWGWLIKCEAIVLRGCVCDLCLPCVIALFIFVRAKNGLSFISRCFFLPAWSCNQTPGVEGKDAVEGIKKENTCVMLGKRKSKLWSAGGKCRAQNGPSQ